MAKMYNNTIARGLTRSGKTVIASQPGSDDHRVFLDAHGAQRQALREAVRFANSVETQEVYIHKAMEFGTTPYSIAILDWFGEPKVLEINVDDWTGKRGQTIRVKARDNVRVARVTVVIRDLHEEVLESGDAVQSQDGSVWWDYTTQSQTTMTPFPIVEAIAQDLPGNTDSFVIS